MNTTAREILSAFDRTETMIFAQGTTELHDENGTCFCPLAAIFMAGNDGYRPVDWCQIEVFIEGEFGLEPSLIIPDKIASEYDAIRPETDSAWSYRRVSRATAREAFITALENVLPL